MTESAFLLVAVDDLMLGSRIETTARHLGYGVRYARNAEQFWAGVGDHPSLVVLGTSTSGLDWESLLAELEARDDAPPVLGFGKHTDQDSRKRARKAGVTRWVPNSSIATDLPKLIEKLARPVSSG